MKTRMLFITFLLAIAILFSTSISADIVQPAGGENGEYWMTNTTQTIKWDTSYFHNYVNLYLWDMMMGQMRLIDTNIQASLGEYFWTISDSLMPGNYFRIKVQQTDSSIYAMSQTFFPLYPYQQPEKSGVKGNENSPTLLSVFPNPVNSTLDVIYQLHNESNVQIQIINLFGQTLLSRSDSFYNNENGKKITFDVSSLPSGIYFVVLRSNSIVLSRQVAVLR
jgi:hypothetical protein